MMLLSMRNVYKCPMKYSSIIFSIVHKLLIGLYDPMSYIGFPALCLGEILSILKVFGNILFNMICVVKCVTSGAIVSMVFLTMFIDMLSCPVECELGALIIMFRMSSNVGSRIENVLVFRGYICLSTSIGLTGMFGICSLRFLMELM